MKKKHRLLLHYLLSLLHERDQFRDEIYQTMQ